MTETRWGQAPAGIPQRRIVEKLNEYTDRRDYAGAERHLLYWLDEALYTGERRGELMVRGELIGHYRKNNEKEKAFDQIEKALALIEELSFRETISAGTTYVNAATALNAFGENERAAMLFEKAAAVYESSSQTDPHLLAGLCNNTGLALAALGRYEQARERYEKALALMETVPDGRPHMAITCLNMADLVYDQLGMEAGEKKIFELLDRAQEYLFDPGTPRDGYYAFVCEKCAPSFSFYGYFAAAEELNKRSDQICAANAQREERGG